MERFILDLRLALRRFRQNPTFSAVAVLTLALGIGANTAIFSIINAALLRRLPVARGSEIVSLNEKMGGDMVPTLSFPNYRDLRDRNTVLSGLMAYRFLPASLGLPGNNQRLWGYLVTGNYFDVLGVGAARGRVLHPDDDLRPGGHPVAVLTWPCWQKRFGGDPTVVGRTVKINGMDFTILGVTPQGFFGTELFFAARYFLPVDDAEAARRRQRIPGEPRRRQLLRGRPPETGSDHGARRSRPEQRRTGPRATVSRRTTTA